MQHLEGSGTPVLYIGRTVLKGQLFFSEFNLLHFLLISKGFRLSLHYD